MPRRCTAARLHSVGIDLRIFLTFARHFEDIHRSVIRPAERAPHRRTADVHGQIKHEGAPGSERRLEFAVSANAAARDDEIFGVRTARTNGISHSLLCGRFSLTPCILAVPCRPRGVPAHCCISALRAAHFRHTRRQRCSSVIQTAPRALHTRRHRADLAARSLYKLAPPPCFRCTDFDGFCRRAYFKK